MRHIYYCGELAARRLENLSSSSRATPVTIPGARHRYGGNSDERRAENTLPAARRLRRDRNGFKGSRDSASERSSTPPLLGPSRRRRGRTRAAAPDRLSLLVRRRASLLPRPRHAAYPPRDAYQRERPERVPRARSRDSKQVRSAGGGTARSSRVCAEPQKGHRRVVAPDRSTRGTGRVALGSQPTNA